MIPISSQHRLPKSSRGVTGRTKTPRCLNGDYFNGINWHRCRCPQVSLWFCMIQYLYLCFDVSCLACFEKLWETGIASHWETCQKMSTWEFKSSNASAIAAPYVYDTCLKLEWASELLFASSSPVFTGFQHTHILYLSIYYIYIYVLLRSLYIPSNPFSSSSANPFLEFYWCSNPHPSHQPINSFNRALIAFTATPVSSAITPTPLHHSWLRAGGLGLPSWSNIGLTNKKGTK